MQNSDWGIGTPTRDQLPPGKPRSVGQDFILDVLQGLGTGLAASNEEGSHVAGAALLGGLQGSLDKRTRERDQNDFIDRVYTGVLGGTIGRRQEMDQAWAAFRQRYGVVPEDGPFVAGLDGMQFTGGLGGLDGPLGGAQ